MPKLQDNAHSRTPKNLVEHCKVLGMLVFITSSLGSQLQLDLNPARTLSSYAEKAPSLVVSLLSFVAAKMEPGYSSTLVVRLGAIPVT